MRLMSNKKSHTRTSSEIIDDLKKISGVSNDSDLAEILGVRANYISTWRTRNTIPHNEIALFCEMKGMSYSGILTGENLKMDDKKKYRASPDLSLVREVIEVVEDVFQKKNLSLPAAKKAELICLLCEEITEDETRKKSMGERVLRLVKLAS